MFSGIGGFRLGMENAGHRCLAFFEWDKFARKSYKAMHDTENEGEYHDVKQVSNEDLEHFRGRVDVICGGFPCQAFSVAGRRGGFEDTRGTLFFDIARFASVIQPKYLFLENVKGLLNHNKGETFRIILNTLDELGYDVEWQVLNSKHFGVPQSRERVYIVGHLRGQRTGKVFPIGTGVGQTSAEIKIIAGKENYRQSYRVYDDEGIVETLSTMQGGGRHPHVLIREATSIGYKQANVGDSINYSVPNSSTRRGRVGNGIANTLDTACNQATLLPEGRIRRLTPRECWRLQSFPDHLFDRAREVNSDAQLYKQAGNSVTVNVVSEIASRLT